MGGFEEIRSQGAALEVPGVMLKVTMVLGPRRGVSLPELTGKVI